MVEYFAFFLSNATSFLLLESFKFHFCLIIIYLLTFNVFSNSMNSIFEAMVVLRYQFDSYI